LSFLSGSICNGVLDSSDVHFGPRRLRQRGRVARKTAAWMVVSAGKEVSTEWNPLQLGIKAVAVGKFGSKPIPEELEQPIRSTLEGIWTSLVNGKDREAWYELLVQRASFLGSLFVKHTLLPHEGRILASEVRGRVTSESRSGRDRDGMCSAGEILELVSPTLRILDPYLYQLIIRLLGGNSLNREDSQVVGSFLFKKNQMRDLDMDPLRALVAHVMRVKHETSDELCGLVEAALGSTPLLGSRDNDASRPAVHLAEPFDGVEHSFLVTPLIAHHLSRKWSLRTSYIAGSSNPGPKRGFNVKDLMLSLSKFTITSDVYFGEFFDIEDHHPGLGNWLDLRRSILKRPGIAMVEKFVHDDAANILITSVFHGSVGSKMLDMSVAAGFNAAVVAHRGLEGSLSLPVHVSSKPVFQCQYLDRQRNICLRTIEFASGYDTKYEETPRPQQVDAEENARLVFEFAQTGASSNPDFDTLAKRTLDGIDAAFQLLHAETPLFD